LKKNLNLNPNHLKLLDKNNQVNHLNHKVKLLEKISSTLVSSQNGGNHHIKVEFKMIQYGHILLFKPLLAIGGEKEHGCQTVNR
jgi:hypothetical protein